jgi:signal transduction histidine kinase
VAGLVLGVTFLFFILRFNIFRMSVSLRSLRHFIYTLALVLLVMLAGPALGAEENELFRRFVAWGLLLALVGGVAYTPLVERGLKRYAWFRRLFGRTLTQEAMDHLTERIHDLRLSEKEMTDLAMAELGRLLATEVRFLSESSTSDVNGSVACLWGHFSDPSSEAFNRLDVPSSDLASILVLLDLHAVFPLRVGDDLKGIVSLGASATGAGYQEGEMEAVRTVLRQLAASLELRQLLEAQLANERRQSEQERLRMLGLVSASLAHELKNPLSSMKALAQTVREELASENPESDQSRDMDLIVEQIDRMSAVAREVLGFSRVDPGSKASLASLVESATYVLEHEARRRGIAMDRSSVENVGEVPGSAATWQTIVFNLILNAIHHAPKGSEVSIRLRRDAEQLLFETENSGPAIAEEIHRRLFEPFVSGGCDDNYSSGTGLGLALVGRRVRELGGSVELVNEPDHIIFRVSISEAKGEG